MNQAYWRLFLLSTGAASTAVEVVGLRLIAPVFGSSLPVWGGVIAAVLAGLSIGYWWGGRMSQRPTSYATVQRWAALAAGVFLILPLGIRVAWYLRDVYFSTGSVAAGGGGLLLAWLMLVPPSILFGFISPLAVEAQMQAGSTSAGHSAGAVYTLTTLGSLVGILLPAFVFVPWLGTRITIWLFAGAVLVLSAPSWVRLPSTRLWLGVAIALAVTLDVLMLWGTDSQEVFAKDTAYQYVRVRESPSGDLALIFDGGFGIQSMFSKELFTGNYWDFVGGLPAYLDADAVPHDVLVLGSAASSAERQMSRYWTNRVFNFTSVELDPVVLEVAERYFDPPDRQTYVADARRFVFDTEGTYDLVILDTYANELTVPFHLTTVEFFQAVRDRVDASGFLAINLNATSTDTLFMRSMVATLRQVWPEVAIISIPDSCNHLVLASREPLDLPEDRSILPNVIQGMLPTLSDVAYTSSAGGIIFTDDRSPAELLGVAALCG